MNIYILSFAIFGMLAAAHPTDTRSAGDECKPRSVFCADGDGISPRYLKCVYEKLVEGFCPQDSICVGSRDTTIFCATDHSRNTTNTNPHTISTAPATTLTVVVHQSQQAHAVAPTPKPPPALMFASKPPSQQQQQQQQPMVPTQPFAGSPQASPISSFVSDHIPFNGGQVPQHQQPPLSRPTPAPVLQDVHQKPWAPVSQEPQRNSRDQPFLAATTIPTNSNNAARTPSPPSLQPGKAPTLPGTYYHPSLQRPPPPRPMAGPPHALQKDGGTNSVPAQPLIGGIEAERILSVVGGAIFSQLALSTAAESEERSAATSTVVEPQHVAPPSSNLREEETNAMPPVVPLAPPPPPPSPPSPPSQSDNNPMAYLPQSLPPPVCNPGSFVCAVHGLDVGYFACDSAGLALPASCAANEVCYQYGQSILCAAPGGAPEVNVLLGHPSF